MAPSRIKRPATAGRKKRKANVTLANGKTVHREIRQFKMGGGDVCGATKLSGDPCVLAAGWGTPHPGIGRCKFHGGLNPAAIRHSLSTEMKQLMGFEMEMDPYDALLWCIKITAGEIHWLSHKLSQIPEKQWLENTLTGKKINVWARQREIAIERLAKFSKWAIDAGLEERKVRIAELYGEMLGRLIKGILDDLHLDPQQREDSAAIVRKHLHLLEQRSIFNSAQDQPLVAGVDPDTLTPDELDPTPPHA
jgi:hypothetical protein